MIFLISATTQVFYLGFFCYMATKEAPFKKICYQKNPLLWF
ncbi:hypothetical protein THERMOS_2123 [Bathymodiolus thermophilus thioautotrophic gill symbiont]|uniref:Uncharacterized protein n=1 Tax=Bathymodiolus thermophilus thioautotrophic gill symbiont TaxID=2360 RepID=A0A8H8XEJ3_9GAMM|nr:hypothetical protein THERMOS_2123 [Bathymodiolus thermophilus thioautotrophic gill symbiont]